MSLIRFSCDKQVLCKNAHDAVGAREFQELRLLRAKIRGRINVSQSVEADDACGHLRGNRTRQFSAHHFRSQNITGEHRTD